MINFNDSDIIQYCGKQSYDRGRSCANADNFIKIFIQENVLFGLYEGSVGTYRVNIICDTNIPSYAWCTCPAMTQHEGICKHIAGLMLLWRKISQQFTRLSSWQLLLENKTRDDLIKLIETVSHKSIDVTSAFYEALGHDPLIDYDEIYDPEDEW